jgi:hypothetical protein
MSALGVAVRTYVGVYNEPDPGLKKQMLFDSFEPEGRYISPNVQLGFDELLEMAAGFHLEARMEIVGDVSEHHGRGMFRFRFVELVSGDATTGVDFCQLGPTGRLGQVVVFFD